MIDNNDILEFIDLLNSHKVNYLLVGGYAVIHYSEPRYTKDIDFFIEPTKENAQKILSVLVEFGLPKDQLKLDIFMNEGNFFKLGRPPWRIDLITSLKGVNFDELIKNSISIEIKQRSVPMVSKDDLVKIKKLAGRPQDLLDVEKLSK